MLDPYPLGITSVNGIAVRTVLGLLVATLAACSAREPQAEREALPAPAVATPAVLDDSSRESLVLVPSPGFVETPRADPKLARKAKSPQR